MAGESTQGARLQITPEELQNMRAKVDESTGYTPKAEQPLDVAENPPRAAVQVTPENIQNMRARFDESTGYKPKAEQPLDSGAPKIEVDESGSLNVSADAAKRVVEPPVQPPVGEL